MDTQQCQVCGQMFVNVGLVMSHISVHSRKEIYECLISLKSSLEIFMKQYFGLKEYINSISTQENSNKREEFISTSRVNANGVRTAPHLNNTNDRFVNVIRQSESKGIRPNPKEVGQTPSMRIFENSFVNIEENSIEDTVQTSQKDNSLDNFVDLTEIEIKQEIIENEMDLGHVSENTAEHSLSAAIEKYSSSMENNSPFKSKGDNQTEYIQEGKTENGPVSIIDLSHTDQNIESSRGLRNTANYRNSHPRDLLIMKQNKECVPHNEKNTNRTFIKLNSAHVVGKTLSKLNSATHSNNQSGQMQLNLNEQNKTQNYSGITCLECGRNFATKFVLRRHMMSHTGERTHNCPICGKGFIGKQNMMVHVRVHTGEKPYKCLHCGQQFSQYGTLYRHKKRHMKS